MKKAGLILTCTILACISCMAPMPMQDLADNIPHMDFENIRAVMSFVAERVEYVPDAVMHYPVKGYWQSPLQTYMWQTGDCEDFCILAMYFIRSEFYMEPMLASGWYDGLRHGWVEVGGEYWEPQTGTNVTDNGRYELLELLDYDEVMRRATITHKQLAVWPTD